MLVLSVQDYRAGARRGKRALYEADARSVIGGADADRRTRNRSFPPYFAATGRTLAVSIAVKHRDHHKARMTIAAGAARSN